MSTKEANVFFQLVKWWYENKEKDPEVIIENRFYPSQA